MPTSDLPTVGNSEEGISEGNLECHCAGELRCKVCVAALECQLFVKATSAFCYFCTLLLLQFASCAGTHNVATNMCPAPVPLHGGQQMR